jgi:hypothetical protein
VYESSTGQVSFISVLAWDTAVDAREFFDAYRKRIDLRYPNAKVTRPFEATDGPTATASWKTDEGAVGLNWSGSRVVIIEGCPDGLDPSRLMSVLMQ